MATQFFSDEQMERLRCYPDIGREELVRFFTLTGRDLAFVDNQGRGCGRGPALEASYSYLRQFTPQVLETIDFHGGPGTADLMSAVAMLKALNRAGGRKVPAGAPTSFVPARYVDYLSDPVYRRKISRQLNKGESLHALRRDLHYAQQGTIVRPHLQDQAEQAWCLTLLTNAVITWTTEYHGIAIGQLRDQGRDIGDDLLSFIAPGHRENINFFGFINVDIEAELAKLIEGWRPLRPTAVNEAGTTFMLQP